MKNGIDREKFLEQASKIDVLQEFLNETEDTEEVLSFAKEISDLYNEDGNFFNSDLYCTDYQDEERNKKVRANARKERKQLGNLISKYKEWIK